MPSSYRVRKAVAADQPSIVAYQIAMAKETEGLDLNPELVRKGVRIPFERENICEYIVTELVDDDTGVPVLIPDTTPSIVSQPCVVEDNALFTICSMLMITFEWSDWRGGAIHWIQSVYTHPQHRRRGLFKQLFAFVKQRVEADPDACAIRLYVEHDNYVGIKTYESLGLQMEDGYRMMKWSKHAY